MKLFGWFGGREPNTKEISKEISFDTIIGAFDPWTLACATAAQNRTNNMWFGFDSWLRISEKNWMPEMRARIPAVSERKINDALRRFVESQKDKDLYQVMEEVQTQRGLAKISGDWS